MCHTHSEQTPLSHPPPPTPNHSKSCGQLTSTTWVWICGRQHTSTPSRRFSRFTTRPASSSHRHRTCVSPVSVFSVSLRFTLPLIGWMFYFSSLEPKPKMFESPVDWLLHSPEWKQETRTKVCGHLLMLLENPQVLSFSFSFFFYKFKLPKNLCH